MERLGSFLDQVQNKSFLATKPGFMSDMLKLSEGLLYYQPVCYPDLSTTFIS